MTRKYLSILLSGLLILAAFPATAAWAQENIVYLPGFEEGVNGVDFNYRSPLPQNEDAYILRNSFDRKDMQWKTASLNQKVAGGRIVYVFMAAMSTDNPDLQYELKVNDEETFRFTNTTEKTWTVDGAKGGKLSFYQAKNLSGVEINGFMLLSIPASEVKLGEPLNLRATLLPTQRNAWLIIFRKPMVAGSTIDNVPALVKVDGSVRQQVRISQLQFRQPGKITFASGGKELMTGRTIVGYNQFFVPVPVVKASKKMNIRIEAEGAAPENLQVTVNPVKRWEIYLVEHSHTDIGYTRPQSEILAEHMRYIDYALDYCDQTDNLPDDSKFRWTCESSWVVREYLRNRPQKQIDRLRQRIAEGRIEVTGMYFNMAEVADENIYFDFFQPIREMRDHGIPVRTVMQDDVNGVAWCLPDYLKDTGVKCLTMGINEARSIRPFSIPTCFWWEAPSGSRLLAYRSDHYMTGNFFGLPDANTFDPGKVFEYIRNLEVQGYPFDRVAVQFSGYFTDNAPPSTGACEIVKAWNERYESPKLRLATNGEFPEYVEKNHSGSLPVYRKAWLDWWTDGFGSTSRETAEVRRTQNMEQVDEGLFAMTGMLGGELSPDLNRKIEHISENALFFDEHTVGADESISHPFSENTTRQWLQKGAYAWEALKQVTLLNEEALGRLQPFLGRASFPVIYVINSMGWKRSGLVELFVDKQIIPIGKQFRIIDLTTGREVPYQLVRTRSEGAYWSLSVEDIPAFGWKVFRVEAADQDIHDLPVTGVDQNTLENQYYRITFDPTTGAINSLFDKDLDKELIDPACPWKIGQLVHETLKDRDNMKDKSHTTVYHVKRVEGSAGDLWKGVRFSADLAGFDEGTEGSPRGLDWEIRLCSTVKRIDFYFSAQKEILTNPEALYVTFPFRMDGSRIVFETIGGTVDQGSQLPGSSTDWNVAQNFVSVRGPESQIVMVSDEIPLWQFGDFNLGKFERHQPPVRPWLYSWVMNNYWTTNFRAWQEGGFHWTYQLTTLRDTSNAAAERFARGVRNLFSTRTLPAGAGELASTKSETLKSSGTPNVMVLSSRPDPNKPGAILLFVREVNGATGNLSLTSAVPQRPVGKIVQVNILGDEIGGPLKVLDFKPYEQKFVRVEME